MKRITLGHAFGIEFQLHTQAILFSLLIWAGLALLAAYLFSWTTATAVVWGFFAMLIHWASDLVHHLGHAWAGKRQGYCLEMLRFQHVLIACRYPKNEPELSAKIHIQRALGGPFFSLLLTIIGGILLVLLPPGGFGYALVQFFFWENLLVYFLGAFLPLGFTDGSTLLHWWPRRNP
jgi:hypothetical protein